MTREIKFRVFHKIKKSILEVGWISFQEKTMGFGDGSCWRFNDEVVLMQSTGLKDKNGVEIYEGNIIELETGNNETFIAPVVYNKDECRFDLEHPEGYHGHWNLCLRTIDACNYRSIGNIYENPELLTPAKD